MNIVSNEDGYVITRNPVYLSSNHQVILGERTKTNITTSSRIADIIERYALMIGKSLPDLSDDEWLAICDCQSGSMESTGTLAIIEQNIVDIADDLGCTWGVDANYLAHKIHNMPMVQKMAIAEFVDRFLNWPEMTNDAICWGDVIRRIKQSFRDTYREGNSIVANSFSIISSLDAKESTREN